jgi:hypothetical protein
MQSPEQNKKLGELVLLARKALADEFMKRQMIADKNWIVACDQAWISKGILLPHVAEFAYPTEKEIVNRALELYNEKYPNETTIQETTNTGTMDPVQETSGQIESDIPEQEELIVEEPMIEDVVETVPLEPPETVSMFSSLVTKWGGRGTLNNNVQ